jgi:predicted enzyme related to lactoylglutathione lyase
MTPEAIAVNLNSILIGSENPARLTDYYSGLFGDPGWNEGGFTGWRVGSGGLMVGPHDQVSGSNREPGRMIVNIESPDVAADFERFKAAGAIVVREPYQPGEVAGAWIATFADPDGNYFQLVSPM